MVASSAILIALGCPWSARWTCISISFIILRRRIKLSPHIITLWDGIFLETFPNFICMERKISKNGNLRMDEALKTALGQSGIDDMLLSAVEHADLTMRKYIWRGFKPKCSTVERELIVADKTAKDFVNEALRRLCDGTRAFNSERT